MTQLKPKEIHIPSEAFCKLGDTEGEKKSYLSANGSFLELSKLLFIHILN